MNKLLYGDCLTIMRDMPLGSVDLIYLDPPFNSNRDYNAIYKDETGRQLPDQIEAFNDLWELSPERQQAIRMMPVLMRDYGIDDDIVEFWKIWMNALRNTQPRLLAYLSYMTERLLPMRGILKPTGSVFLHCDPTASHYIKVMMDGIFGHNNFRNEIIWCYTGPGSPGMRQFMRKHDVILWYNKGKTWTFNADDVRVAHSEKTKGNYKKGLVGSGFVEADHVIHEKGKVPEDWWQIAIAARGKEYMRYPTQKPLKLLDRIIRAASNKGETVFDPFCGCATTIEAAHTLGRKWIGIDIAIHAIKRVAKVRLEERLGLIEGKDFVIEGVPVTAEGALDLWNRDKHQFQKWAIEQVDGFVTNRKTADGGIDGRLYFSVPDKRDLQSMVIEVKGGKNVNVDVVRSLRGALERDQAEMAGLIVMDDLGDRKTKNFLREMGEAGDMDVNGVLYHRMQLLTVPEILAGKRFNTPSVARAKQLAQPALPMG
ncbi:site-specific DNA-methyltransferase [Erythrobacteraceae bacterium CFH 75059]|uniref:DNA methyltransferase n=1 Tax=Qipengyuania thermophila TaxID=2509361 RepID=UPI0010229311|nr:DNA methyltransferase [Qipengyuania thermophila]TCD00642.1 site-specific DNA-methyltransferase [Erythrobacteraceae bacterium CFH 75059]